MTPRDCNPAASKRVLAVASRGGHWVQLLRIAPAFADQRITFVTTDPRYRGDLDRLAAQDERCANLKHARLRIVTDATRWNRVRLIIMVLQIAWILLRERPEVIITTGAAPGFVALRLGKLVGRRTIWIDSIANVDELSMSGRFARRHADLWLTQWPHLARPEGPHYMGAVL